MALSLVAGVWVAYGFHNGVPQQYLPNIPLVLTASAVGWFYPNRFRSLVPVALLIAATASGYVDSAIPGLIGVPLGVSMALPQLIAVRRATDLTGVSLPAWVSQLVATILWLVFGIGEGKTAIVISASTQTMICGALVATLALRRRATDFPHPNTDKEA
jgi:uncharacterized protein with PQ loop repeat